jgi:LAS superfamily LD-carboxypeptidase LdcB
MAINAKPDDMAASGALENSILTGQRPPPDLIEVQPNQQLRAAVAMAFSRMAEAAAQDGIGLKIASSYRGFIQQEQIWLKKLRGERPVLNQQLQQIIMHALPPAAQISAILIYSALPGTSRHHWGTDLDVFDAAALPDGYRLQLIPEEYHAGGPCAYLSDWLAQHAEKFGFCRPYQYDNGGVAIEPWHLSYAPIAVDLLRELTLDEVKSAIERSQLPYKDVLCAMLNDIMSRYVYNISQPSWSALHPSGLTINSGQQQKGEDLP